MLQIHEGGAFRKRTASFSDRYWKSYGKKKGSLSSFFKHLDTVGSKFYLILSGKVGVYIRLPS